MTNQIDTNLLIPGTQIGVFTSVNFAHGAELSYTVSPRGGVGPGAYLAYANSIDKPSGLQNTGSPVPPCNDHDVQNTLSTGVDTRWRRARLPESTSTIAAAPIPASSATTTQSTMPSR